MGSMVLSFNAAFSENADIAGGKLGGIPRITLRQLIYFSSAAKHESAIRAAEELHVSPPAISGAISGLESVLGEQLFIRRHARGLVLTKAGHHLLEEARDIIGRVNEIEAIRQRGSQHVAKRLFLGCLGDIAPAIVPPLVRQFEQDHPDVEIRWITSEYAQLMQRLDEGSLDVVIAVDFEASPTLHSTVLQPTPACCVLPTGHPLATGPVSLQALADEPYIMLDIPRTRDYFLSIFGELGLQPNIVHRATSGEMARSLVAHGFGYSLLNFATPANNHDLHYLPLANDVRTSNLVALRQHRRRPSPLLDQLVQQAIKTVANSGIVKVAKPPIPLKAEGR